MLVKKNDLDRCSYFDYSHGSRVVVVVVCVCGWDCTCTVAGVVSWVSCGGLDLGRLTLRGLGLAWVIRLVVLVVVGRR